MLPAIFGLSGPHLTPDEAAFFRDADPAGYILFARNVVDPAQLAALTDELRALHGRERLLIAIDQEGGRVARMRPPHWRQWLPAGAFAALWERAPASAIVAVRAHAEALGLELAEAGISVDCWPLADVPAPDGHDVIGDRAFAAEPFAVAALAQAALDGLARAGVGGVVKHVPGHGRARADSHLALPVVDADVQHLARDLHPFRRLATVPMMMTAHVVYTAWDAELPATLSPTVIGQVIRGELGFDGLLLSDDLDMAALSGSISSRAAAAQAAGCDLALNCWARMDDMVGIAAALAPASAATQARLDRALAGTNPARQAPDPARIDALITLRDDLLALTRGDGA